MVQAIYLCDLRNELTEKKVRFWNTQ